MGRDALEPSAYLEDWVSIHAPAWDATIVPYFSAIEIQRFNPRARVGRDPDRALAESRWRGFNPRARVGRDESGEAFEMRLYGFNPRARVGRDMAMIEIDAMLNGFNPRARVGRDQLLPVACSFVGGVSIHAPAWDATSRSTCLMLGLKAFQSTRPRGTRPGRDGHRTSFHQVSIHAPAWDATRCLRSTTRSREFQSTRPRGTRPVMS